MTAPPFCCCLGLSMFMDSPPLHLPIHVDFVLFGDLDL